MLIFPSAFSVLAIAAAGYYGHVSGIGIGPAILTCMLLGVLELALSVDNAVVNAKVLEGMSPFWQKLFLTLGIFIAVFVMRFFLPLAIVAVAADLSIVQVGSMALYDQKAYAAALLDCHFPISAFGGAFLGLVFLDFILDTDRDVSWTRFDGAFAAKLGRVPSMAVLLMLCAVLALAYFAPPIEMARTLTAGIAGVITYLAVKGLGHAFESDGAAAAVGRAGFMGFLYLEVLDASFSLDGVIGAFAVTRDVVIIMLGLGIGAVFVRGLTLMMVEYKTLKTYIYLEHGAHYAIGALTAITFIAPFYHLPEWMVALFSAMFIVLALTSSVRSNRIGATDQS